MRRHSGMKPQDIVILLKMVTTLGTDGYISRMAASLEISQSEVSESLHRSKIAGLVTYDKREVFGDRLLEFLIFGISYVFPHHADRAARGMPTAHSAQPLRPHFKPGYEYVWRYSEGSARGQVIEPLHPKVPQACLKDEELYHLLILVDAMRVGIPTERTLIIQELKNRI